MFKNKKFNSRPIKLQMNSFPHILTPTQAACHPPRTKTTDSSSFMTRTTSRPIHTRTYPQTDSGEPTTRTRPQRPSERESPCSPATKSTRTFAATSAHSRSHPFRAPPTSTTRDGKFWFNHDLINPFVIDK